MSRIERPICDLHKKARAILVNGRPFIEETSLGEWIGFRWGKTEISVRTEVNPKYPELSGQKWRTRLFANGNAWDLGTGWVVEILRNVDAVIAGKLNDMRPSAQKFYGDLVLRELTN
jgi:hypothetical protein